MKSYFFFLFISLSFANHSFAQSTEDLVANIRSHYTTATSMETSGRSLSCKNGKSFSIENNTRYPKSSKKCTYPNGYSIITSFFEGWEWSASVKYYFLNGDNYFTFITYDNVCGNAEYRIYYNADKVIRTLVKRNDCTDNPQNKNTALSDPSDYNWLMNWNRKRLNDSYSILSGL